MTNSIRTIALPICILLGLTLTNPSEREYAEYMVWNLQTMTCQAPPRSPAIQAFCSTLKVLPRPVATGVISGYSHRQDYIVFSVYTTTFLDLNSQSIGVGKLFFTPPKALALNRID